MLALSIGVRDAARQMGIPEPTVQAWSARGRWFDKLQPRPRHIEQRAIANTQALQPAATKSPVTVLEEAFSDLGNRSKIAHARAGARAAEAFEALPDAELIDKAQNRKALIDGDAKLHNWGAAERQFAVNIYQDGARMADAKVIDVDELTE